MREDDEVIEVPDELTVDVSMVESAEELQSLLKQELRFPDMYGRNWDAFWDAITGLVSIPRNITFRGWRHLESALPDDARLLRSLLDEYVAAHARRHPASARTVTYLG